MMTILQDIVTVFSIVGGTCGIIAMLLCKKINDEENERRRRRL